LRNQEVSVLTDLQERLKQSNSMAISKRCCYLKALLLPEASDTTWKHAANKYNTSTRNLLRTKAMTSAFPLEIACGLLQVFCNHTYIILFNVKII